MYPLKKAWISLFARQRFHKFNDRLLRRGMVGLGINDFGPRQERGEQLLLEKMTRILPQAAVVFDVGAHTGLYANFLIERRPDLIIHAFEPNPVTYAKLAPVASGKYAVHPIALGDHNGEALLHDIGTGGSECASLVGGEGLRELYGNKPQYTVSVPVKKLDDMLTSLGIDRVDYLKIDAEGYDLMVLRGGAESIKAGMIDIVQFEFNTMNVFSRTFMRDFYEILPKHRLFRIVQDGLVPLGNYNPVTCELFGLQNIVGVPEGVIL